MADNFRASSQEPLVVRTFDEKAVTYAAGYSGESATAHSFRIRRERAYEMTADKRGGNILDVGCGPGLTIDHFVSRGFQFYGVDIAPEMIRECEAAFASVPAAHFSVGRIEAMEFPDAMFDVVLSLGVVEYIEDDAAAVREMARVAKPGGAVIVSLPNRVSPYRLWDRAVYRPARRVGRALTGRGPIGPEVRRREYGEREYCALLESHGLRVREVVYYNFKILPFPFDRLLPRAAVAISRAAERFARGRLRWIGTGHLVRADKT
jgi:ubiquinone/menaquinone biosynthesis C-methylase UbiE